MQRKIIFTLVCLFIGSLIIAWGVQKAEAEPQKLTIWCHAVHQQVAEGTSGAKINLAKEFMEKYNVEIEWVSLPWDGMEDKILRELALPESDVDIVFLHNAWANPTVKGMFEPLTAFMGKTPIEAIDDIPQGMRDDFSSDGEAIAVPYRTTTRVLHYNKAIFEEKGITKAPESFEEFIEIAKKTTYTRSDGAQVYGTLIRSHGDAALVMRAFGGDILTLDYQIRINTPESVKGMQALQELYQAGAIPPNFALMSTSDARNLITQGLAATTYFPDSYYVRFNDPEKSNQAGNIEVQPVYGSKEAGIGIVRTGGAWWGAGIPKNSSAETKELAYKFLHYFVSKDAQLKMALNGNGPIRASTYADPTYQEDVPYADITAMVIDGVTPELPTFRGTQELNDLLKEELPEIIIGKKDAQKGLDKIAEKIDRILQKHGVK